MSEHIPLPPKNRGLSASMRKLEPGDSVHLPIKAVSASVYANRVLGAGNYAVRAEGDGCRVWRLPVAIAGNDGG